MKNICFSLFTIFFVFCASQVFGSEAGMPQLDPEFWIAQIFWLIIIFSALYIMIWKIFLPRITYSIENRKSRIVNDLDEAQKLKEKAEKKLLEYNQIIEDAKKEAKKIIEGNRKNLEKDIEQKKQKFNSEIDNELKLVEKEIKDLKKSSISNIGIIASETSSEIIKKIINTDINKSSVNAIVNDIVKKETDKYL